MYATCSMLKVEDQDVVEAFLASHPEFELLNAAEVLAKQGIELPSWQTGRFGNYFVMLPNLHDTDGFFAAVLQKKSGCRALSLRRRGKNALQKRRGKKRFPDIGDRLR